MIVLAPQQFEVYKACEWMASDEFERVNKDTTLKVDAFIAQEVAREADVERERQKRSSIIASPSPLTEDRRLLTPATCTSISERHHC